MPVFLTWCSILWPTPGCLHSTFKSQILFLPDFSKDRKLRKASTSSRRLTVLPRLLNERVHATFPVVPLRGHRGHVVPSHGLDDVHHSLGLVSVWWHHTWEEIVARVVAQLRRSGSVAYLWYLHREKRKKKSEYYMSTTWLLNGPHHMNNPKKTSIDKMWKHDRGEMFCVCGKTVTNRQKLEGRVLIY